MSKTLFVFDFDNTLINVNVDDWFTELAPDKPWEDSGFTTWTDYMQHIFTAIQSRGYTKEQIVTGMESIKISQPIKEACRAINTSQRADAIIISDANTFSIKQVLKANGMAEMFKEIISNPAHFDSQGLFKIDYYHRDHGCPSCPANLCKTEALVPHKVGYNRIVYVGDGYNDICPSLSLSSNDVVLARKGLYLAKHVNDSGMLKATLHVLDFDEALLKTVQEILV